eukprot:CAMPEP_0198133472 /NCGR_PEP_ID=MMETSP1442-20131203/59581_1 /TAXON_ID= /ORGANISM="Craspedostauros australis, Strain CCMP3328" /LENGTH=589 /DNA_ID=CAMNT_0043794593 /DNA_START=76 /DNA_END=1846 /DNA_ORIENTATION=+
MKFATSSLILAHIATTATADDVVANLRVPADKEEKVAGNSKLSWTYYGNNERKIEEVTGVTKQLRRLKDDSKPKVSPDSKSDKGSGMKNKKGKDSDMTAAPTMVMPTASPTSAPTDNPTSAPTSNPTASPTSAPTSAPTVTTSAPTSAPTAPTAAPTSAPTDNDVATFLATLGTPSTPEGVALLAVIQNETDLLEIFANQASTADGVTLFNDISGKTGVLEIFTAAAAASGDMFTGTAAEAAVWCAEAGRTCCTGTDACSWVGVASIASNSCIGKEACESIETQSIIFQGSCLSGASEDACAYFNFNSGTNKASIVGPGSCIDGEKSCYSFAQQSNGDAIVGAGSCKGTRGCAAMGAGPASYATITPDQGNGTTDNNVSPPPSSGLDPASTTIRARTSTPTSPAAPPFTPHTTGSRDPPSLAMAPAFQPALADTWDTSSSSTPTSTSPMACATTRLLPNNQGNGTTDNKRVSNTIVGAGSCTNNNSCSYVNAHVSDTDVNPATPYNQFEGSTLIGDGTCVPAGSCRYLGYQFFFNADIFLSDGVCNDTPFAQYTSCSYCYYDKVAANPCYPLTAVFTIASGNSCPSCTS